MEFGLDILQGNRFEACNHCNKGELKENKKGLDYPYLESYEIRIGNTQVKLCLDCLKRLFKEIEFVIFNDKNVSNNESQQRSELNQHTAGGHDIQRASTPNRKINSGDKGTGNPLQKSSADVLVSKEVKK